MTNFSLIKKASAAFAGLAVFTGVLFAAGSAHAIPFTGPNTPNSPTPAFNVYTGVDQGVGNESDFLRARVPTTPTGDSTTPYVDPLSAACTPGQRIQMRVYVHNGASVAGNQNGQGPSVAHGTSVKVNLPTNEASTFTASSTISSSNAGVVNDNVTINCNGKTVRLKYQAGSASAFSKATGVVPLSDAIVSTGVPIRSQSVEGDVWGCWDDRVYVILSVVVEEVVPPTPEFSCDLLKVTPLSDKKYRFTVTYTAKNGATFKNVTYNIDGTKVTDDEVYDHTFTSNGDKDVTATVNFTVNGKTESKTSKACAEVVTVTKDNCPIKGKEHLAKDSPRCKRTPTVLVETGPGGTLALFAATSAIGAFLYRLHARRGNA